MLSLICHINSPSITPLNVSVTVHSDIENLHQR